MKRLLVACAFALVAACLMAAASPAMSQTFLVSPSAPVLGDSLVFSGCGWTQTNKNLQQNLVQVSVQLPDGSHSFVNVAVPKSGCFTTSGLFTDPVTGLPGDYRVVVAGDYQVRAFQGGAGKTHQGYLAFPVG